MDYQTRELTCADCGNKFEFTAEEQEFFASKGFSEPKRCPECRAARKRERNSNSNRRYNNSY